MKKSILALAFLLLIMEMVFAVTCSNCGKEVDSSYKFCPYCGMRLWVCPECGAEVERSFSFCPQCGFRLWEEEKEQEQEPIEKVMNERIQERRVAVLPCFGPQDLGDWIEDGLLREIESYILENFEHIEVLNRDRVKKAAEKNEMCSRENDYTDKQLKAFGKDTGANVLVFCRINHFSLENKEDMLGEKSYLVRFNVDGMVYDVSKQEEIYSHTFRKKYFSMDRATDVIDSALGMIARGNFLDFVENCPYPWTK